MGFVTKTWKDRLVEFSGRRKLKNVSTNEEIIYDVSRSEGTIMQVGDQFSAENMNNLEQRIKTEFDSVNSSLDDCKIISEGEGENTKYYLQKGADTASKKLLGDIQLNNAELIGSYCDYKASTMTRNFKIAKPYKLVICLVASKNPHDNMQTYSSITVNSNSQIIGKSGINNGGQNQGASYAIIINPNIGDTIIAKGTSTMGVCVIGIN